MRSMRNFGGRGGACGWPPPLPANDGRGPYRGEDEFSPLSKYVDLGEPEGPPEPEEPEAPPDTPPDTL
jgi:hypothetical protein